MLARLPTSSYLSASKSVPLGAHFLKMTIQPRRPLSTSKSNRAEHPRPLYASQSTLPHLPVPTLESTMHKYLETLLPLQSSDAQARSSAAAKKFLASDFSKTLQKRLEDRAKERDSWLSEWWNDVAYMGYRGRIIPNVSYFYLHRKGVGKGEKQEDRAAELVRAAVEFKKLTDSELLEPEKVKGQPLCMASYKYMFNAVRIPTTPADIPVAYEPTLNHIVVLRNNRYWKVNVAGRGKKEIAEAFREIKKQSDGKAGSGLGILTAEDRDLWSDARRHLLSVSSKNTERLQAIDSAILLVCLDDNAPSTEDERSWSYWSGGLSRSPKRQGWNRWFDKHEIIVDEAGESGFNGEHSMLDGTPTVRLNEFMLAGIEKGKIPLELPEGERATSVMPPPEEIVFELDQHLEDVIAKAQKDFGREMELQDLKMVNFTGYGKEVIKTHKASPDAWAQMVKQLAFYREKGRPGVTYESCQTRKFLLGRTEVIRSTSNEAFQWVKAMENPKATNKQREELFRKAVTRHIQYSAWAADGQGVDRHMFGLKQLVRKEEEVPEVFKEEVHGKSSHWEMSTSQLSTNYFDGWGYGEVVEDGYGLSYAIHDNNIRWCVTTKNNDAAKFGQALCKAAEDLRKMMDYAKAAGGEVKANL